MEVGTQQSQFAYLQAKDLADAVDGVLRTHDVALWNGNDTSLSTPTTPQYFGAIDRSRRGQHTNIAIGPASWTAEEHHRGDGRKFVVRCASTAIYANPVLLDLIDREMKAEFNVVLSTAQITAD